jgi:hypothetical protein
MPPDGISIAIPKPSKAVLADLGAWWRRFATRQNTTSIAKEGVLQATDKPKSSAFFRMHPGKKIARADFVAAAKTLRPKQEN